MSAGVKLTACVNGAVVSVPISVAPRKNSTLVTAALSLAVAASVVEPGATTGVRAGREAHARRRGVGAERDRDGRGLASVRIGWVAVSVKVVVPVTLTVASSRASP